MSSSAKSSGAILSVLGLGLVLSLASAHAADSSSRTRYLGQTIEVVDLHTHPGRFESLGPVGKDFLRKTMPGFMPVFLKDLSLSAAASFLLNPFGKFIGIKTESESAGLNRVGLFAVYSPDTWGVTSNEEVISYLDDEKNWDVRGKPYFFGLASVRMQDWQKNEAEQLAQLRKALDHSQMKGIKLAFIHNSIPLDDAQYDSVYQVAEERGVPVYHHVGSSPLRRLTDFASEEAKARYLKSYDPRGLERAIKKFPKVPFILGHMGHDFNNEGNPFVDQVFDLARRYPNVYLEISAFGEPNHDPDGLHMEAMLRMLQEQGMIGRTLYGSDGPTIPGGSKQYLEATMESMQKLGFSHAEAQAVLAGTTNRLFKLKTPTVKP